MRQMFREIEEGDIINGKDIVTGNSESLIYTDGNTYTFRGADDRYKRIKKVSREGIVIYESHHGGKRIGAFKSKKVSNKHKRGI